jgi:formate dehydrogenase
MTTRNEPTRTQPTYCRICEAACGLLVDLDAAGQPVRIRPDRQHPVSQGFVCAKGTRFLEVAQHPDRLLYPRCRTSDGSHGRVTWAEAITFFAGRLRPILDQYGPHSVGLYFGNPLAFNMLGALTMVAFMRGLGTRNVFTAGSQDCNNKFAGAQLIHGSPLIHPIPDFQRTDLAVMLGTNPAVSQSSFIHLEGGSRVFDELIRRDGQIFWVDPRRTESARRWGEHLPIRPGTDIFLLLALINELRDQYDPQPTVTGLEPLLELAADFSVQRTAALTGLASTQIERLAELIRATPRTTFHMSVGVNQGPFGTLCYVALQALAYLSGNFDRPGGMLFHPLAVLAAQFTRRLQIGTGSTRSRVGNFPSVLDTLPGGILADEILTPGPEQIRALIVVAGDPVKSIPGAPRLQEALEKLELLVSLDLFINDTNRQADLLLPTTSWLERWDVATTTAFFQQTSLLQYAGPVQAAPGETRPEAQILTDLSLAIGQPVLGNGFLAWLWSKLTRDAGISTLADFLLWPVRVWLSGTRAVPVPRPRPGRYLGRGPRTPGRKVRFWQPALAAETERLAQYAIKLGQETVNSGSGFTLICRRRRLGHNSWLHGAVHDGETEAAAWMSPEDLARLGLISGDEILLQTDQAGLKLPVKAMAEVTVGTVVVPHGLPGSNVNALIPGGIERIEPVSGQHRLTGIRVQVTAV